jgi:2-polyprenyl-3-methyl-5-hydroxy-6-metoxy-1,4-benzoquinol methylase
MSHATMDAMEPEYARVNLANWNSRVPHHEAGYGLQAYRDDPKYLSSGVRFDMARLGDITGLDAVHLQCHIGTDTLSLARLGARPTGLDFSAPALAVARQLATDGGAAISFVEAELHDAINALGGERFDLVYTGLGALCWLPDIRRWAAIVAGLLRPGGRLFLREGHPVLWSLSDPRPDGLLVIESPYFEVPGGTRYREKVTYVAHDGELTAPDTIQFNHGLGEIISALLAVGLRLTMLEEHRSVPWNALGDAMVEGADGEWRLREAPARLALSYTLQAVKQ